MTIEERNKIPDTERIKQFCLNTARNLCDELSDTKIEDGKTYEAVKTAMEFIENCVRTAKLVDGIKESEVKEDE